MKKTIYLHNLEDYNIIEKYKYENVKKLKKEFIKRGIVIGDYVELGNNVRLGNNVELGYYVRLGNNVELGNNVRIGNYVELGYGVRLGNNVELGNYVELGKGVKVKDKTVLAETPLQIQGSEHLVTVIGKDIQIGCITMTKSRWVKLGERLAKKNGYSKEEIKEYKNYLKFIK